MKKRISYFLVFCLIFSTCLTASAVSNSQGGKSLESAILTAKSLINVPAEYTNLTQYSYEVEYDGVKTDAWQISWSHPEGKGSISVTIDASGNLLNFYQYIYREKTPSLSDFTSAQGKSVADAFLKKVWPDHANDMREVADSNSDSKPYAVGMIYPSDSFQYSYKLYRNNLPVDFVTANVSVDKYTKEVSSFNRSGIELGQYNFSDSSGLIDKKEASESYIDNIGLGIEYFSYYNDKEQKMQVYSAYVLQNKENKVIDAKTGKPVSLYSEALSGGYDAGGGAAPQARSEAVADKEMSLSPQEQSAVDTVAGLISKAEAEKTARTLPGVTSDMQVRSSSLYNEYYDKTRYVWNISFDQCYVSIDAKTGEVYSFSFYGDRGKGNKDLKADAAKKNAEAFLQKFAGKKFTEVKYVDNTRYFTLREGADGKIVSIPNPIDDTVYYFSYERQVNGVNFSSNGMYVTVDRTTGEVINYNLTWYENLSFPSLQRAMTKEEAFKIFDKMADFSVSYMLTGKKQAVAAYDFSNKERIMIHPESGARLNWNGQPYQSGVPVYKDIQGHWAEKIILTLAENGYYLNSGGEFFNPDKNISQLDFFLYCYSQSIYTDVDYLYDMLLRNGILTKSEQNPKADVTRQEAAKYITRMMGYEKLAQNTSIFKDIAKDEIEDSYKGYAAIITGLNIMSVDAQQNFYPAKLLTNAETAAIVYNYLQIQ